MIKPPWVLDSYALEHIAKLPADQTQFGWASFRHYYYNSYKVPCVATFLIWGLFLTLALASGLSAFVERFFPHFHHALSKRAAWWRGNVSEHPLVTEKHSQTVSCGKGSLSWLTLHLPLRLEAILLVAMVALNVVPLVAFYSLYVGHNTYFTGTDSVSRRDQILRHLANRCAMIGIGQIPMLILLASKRTPVALLSQLSMNTMMLFHRWIARMCYLHIVIHTVMNILIFHFSTGLLDGFKRIAVQFGVVAIVMLFGLVFLSLRTLRKKHYEVFVFLHISMAVLLILFTYLHIKFLHQGRLALQIFVMEMAAGFYAFDRTIRILGRVAMSLSWRYADGSGATRKAELTAYGNGAYTRVRIQVPASRLLLAPEFSSSSFDPYLDFEDNRKQQLHRISGSVRSSAMPGIARIGAGDDIRITIPKLQWVGDHPFSVFAVGRSKSGNPDMGYVDLVIQRQAGLTQKLSKLAQELSSSTTTNSHRAPNDVYLRHAVRPKGKRVRVVIDGPFGKSPSLEGAQHAVLVAGGIAITFCYPLLVKAARGEFSSLETCKLVWIVRNESILDVLRDSLPELLEEIRSRGGSRCKLSIDIYTTTKAKKAASALSELVIGEKEGRLPSTLEPAWQASPGWTNYSTSSLTTLVGSGENSAASSLKQSKPKARVWGGVGYRRQDDLELMPTLSKEASLYQQLPGSPAAVADHAFTISRRGLGATPFENKFSPSFSPYNDSEVTLDAPQPSSEWGSWTHSPNLSKTPDWLMPQTLPSTYSSQDISSEPVDRPRQTYRQRDREPEEVMLLGYRSQRDADTGTSTPTTPYADSISGSSYNAYRSDSSSSSMIGFQPYLTTSNASNACSIYSVLPFDNVSPSYPSSMYSVGTDELHQPAQPSQDVLSATEFNALIEIRRHQGRPKTMGSIHEHITRRADREDSGRIVFATCGPAPMCDSVRAEVVALLKRGMDAALVEDCFNW